MAILLVLIFSNGGHLEFSTRLNFTILKSWNLIIVHMKFEIHGCSGLRFVVVLLFYVHGKHLRSCRDGHLI